MVSLLGIGFATSFRWMPDGAYLGIRRGADTWHARLRDRSGVQLYKALDGIRGDDYEGAKRAAEAWFEQLGSTAIRSLKRTTIRVALEAYLADLKRHGRADTARDALWRLKLAVYKDPIADLALESATRDDFLEWRDRLNTGRQARSVNRHVRAVVAGLNRALELGHVGNASAWHLTPLQDEVEEEGETAVLLPAEHRKALIAAATAPAAAFLRGLELTGARPKELAAATVSDFGGESLKLAHRKGRPPRLRVRYVVLSDEGRRFFEAQVTDKLPDAPYSRRTASSRGAGTYGRARFAPRSPRSTRRRAARRVFRPELRPTRFVTPESPSCSSFTGWIR